MKLMKGVGEEGGNEGPQGDGDSGWRCGRTGWGGPWLVKLCSSGLWGPGGAPRSELLWVAGSHGKGTGVGVGGRLVPEEKEHSRVTEGVQAWVWEGCFPPEPRQRRSRH